MYNTSRCGVAYRAALRLDSRKLFIGLRLLLFLLLLTPVSIVPFFREEFLLGVIFHLGNGCSFMTAASAVDMKRATFERYYDVIINAILAAGRASEGTETDFSVTFPTGGALETECERWATSSNGDERYADFYDCCGAGDGTLIPVCFKDGDFDVGAHRTRKGKLTNAKWECTRRCGPSSSLTGDLPSYTLESRFDAIHELHGCHRSSSDFLLFSRWCRGKTDVSELRVLPIL